MHSLRDSTLNPRDPRSPGKGAEKYVYFPKPTPDGWRRWPGQSKGVHRRPRAHGPQHLPRRRRPRAGRGGPSAWAGLGTSAAPAYSLGAERRAADGRSHRSRHRAVRSGWPPQQGRAGRSAATRPTQPPETQGPGIGPSPQCGLLSAR